MTVDDAVLYDSRVGCFVSSCGFDAARCTTSIFSERKKKASKDHPSTSNKETSEHEERLYPIDLVFQSEWDKCIRYFNEHANSSLALPCFHLLFKLPCSVIFCFFCPLHHPLVYRSHWKKKTGVWIVKRSGVLSRHCRKKFFFFPNPKQRMERRPNAPKTHFLYGRGLTSIR